MQIKATKLEYELLEWMCDTWLDSYAGWDRSYNPQNKTLEQFNNAFGDWFDEESLKTCKALIKQLRSKANGKG